MPCKNSKCKRICAHCEHVILKSDGLHQCSASERQVTNCVTGEKETKYDLCVSMNDKGNCSKFKMDKEKQIFRIIIKALEKFDSKVYRNYGLESPNYCDSIDKSPVRVSLNKIQKMLLSNLLKSLKGEEIDFEYWSDPKNHYNEYIIYKYDIRKYRDAYQKYLKCRGKNESK